METIRLNYNYALGQKPGGLFLLSSTFNSRTILTNIEQIKTIEKIGNKIVITLIDDKYTTQHFALFAVSTDVLVIDLLKKLE